MHNKSSNINTNGLIATALVALNTISIGVLTSGYIHIPATKHIIKLNNTNNRANIIVATNLPVIIFQRLNGLIASNLIVPLSYSEAIKLADRNIAKILIINVAISIP